MPFLDIVDDTFNHIIRNFKQYSPKILSQDPWVITLDNVFTEEDANIFIDLNKDYFVRSTCGTSSLSDKVMNVNFSVFNLTFAHSRNVFF